MGGQLRSRTVHFENNTWYMKGFHLRWEKMDSAQVHIYHVLAEGVTKQADSFPSQFYQNNYQFYHQVLYRC